MRLSFILILTILIAGFVTVSATIINVPADYDTIQVAINASSNGDTVLVAEGHYYERINLYGKGILLTSEFMLDGDTMHIQNTIIDADTLVLGVADTGSVVCLVNGEDSTSVIQGFTIQNGIGIIMYYSRYGGGIYCYESSPTISNNTITGNSAGWYGGGIYCGYNSSPTISNNTISDNSTDVGGGIYCIFSSPTINNNTITGNSVYLGGGIYCENSNPTINNNTICGNSADDFGGGIYCRYNSSPTISNNTINENSADHDGGGIFCDWESSPIISNNTISENSADDYGGGIFCDWESSPIISNNTISENFTDVGGGIVCRESNPTISNNTITGNFANYYGGGIFCYRSDPVIVNTIFWANIAGSGSNEIYIIGTSSISITYSDIQDTLWLGEGNIDIDPLFRDPDNNDFHLMAIECGDSVDSPCIDAGHPDILDSLLDCAWGLGTILSDMGAYGGGDSAEVGIDIEQSALPNRFILLQNYPNPFNTSTVIRYNLAEPSAVTIDIYDILGRKVVTLIDMPQLAGYHQIVWNADGFSSGIYFYKFTAGEYENTKKMMLLK